VFCITDSGYGIQMWERACFGHQHIAENKDVATQHLINKTTSS